MRFNLDDDIVVVGKLFNILYPDIVRGTIIGKEVWMNSYRVVVRYFSESTKSNKLIILSAFELERFFGEVITGEPRVVGKL